MTTLPHTSPWLLRVQRGLDHGARRGLIRLAVFAAFALWALWHAFGDAGQLNDFYDAHFLLGYEDHAVRTVLEHAQLPWWDPYSCGGLYSLGNPQTRWGAPTLLLSLLFGAARAVPLVVFAMLIIGAEGTYRLIRLRTPSPGFAMLAAPIYMLSGYLAAAYWLGWVQFFGFALMPWVLYGTTRALRGDLRGHLVAAVAFAFMVGFGGTYATPFTVLLAALEGLACAPRQRAWRPWGLFLLRGAALAVLLLAISWFRVGPILDEMARAPRVMAGAPGHTFGSLVSMAFGQIPDNPVGFPPGRLYIGLAPLALVAILGAFRRRMWAHTAITLFLIVAATGYHYGAGPFVWLRELPVFDTLRYPERLLLVATPLYAEHVASGLWLMTRWARRRPRLWVLPAAATLLLITSVSFEAARFEGLTHHMTMVSMPIQQARPFQQARGNRWKAGFFSYQSRGSISCGEAYPVAMSTELRGDLPADEYLTDPAAGTVHRDDWSPGRVALTVDLRAATTLRVNQNYHPGWRSSVGVARSDQGLIAVDLPAGRHEVVLSFLPRSGVVGLGTSLLALLLAFAVLRWRARRGLAEPRALAAFIGGPLLAFAVVSLLAPSEVRDAPRLVNADGTPLVIEALPADAERVDVAFAAPVELLGGRLVGPDAEGMLRGELWFRITGGVPREVGVFAHIEQGGRVVREADHEVLGGTWFFANAPRDVILRDAFTVMVDRRAPGTFTLFAGLWNISGDKRRVPMISHAPTAEVRDDRVRLGDAVPSAP
ncbi:MAG: hypothetical protein CVU56_26005 [Deltaproteobacteria bacterium HGW-Deltaproteobacteria-14]|nr:MAG: hypothetical protein CVU56_26005 [Deltaproteobacteria bacterium HGW-Deltaproteobacteria-14]